MPTRMTTAYPSAPPTPWPSAAPAPGPPPTAAPSVYPMAVPSGTSVLPPSAPSILLSLSRVAASGVVAPVARSYDGLDWELSVAVRHIQGRENI